MNRRTTQSLLGFLICVLCLSAHPVFGAMRAPVPDNNTLQPIPKLVQPHISGNVNATTHTTTTSATSQEETVAPQEASIVSDIKDIQDEKGWPLWAIVVVSLIGLTIVGGILKIIFFPSES